MGIFEENMAVLRMHAEKMADHISTMQIETGSQRTEIFTSTDGNLVPRIIRDGEVWNLNSCLYPEKAAKMYADRYTIKAYQILFIFGFADGRCIRHLLKQCDGTNRVFICIPDMDEFAVECRYFAVADLMEDERIYFYFPQTDKNLAGILASFIGYEHKQLVEFCILPGQDILYTAECREAIDTLVDLFEREIVHKSTRLGFGRMIPRHMLYHMKNVICQRNIAQIKQKLEAYQIQNIPAIIVSAGPSLDRNVHRLRQAQGKAFIMVVDAALRTVLNAGIRPDMVCTIDPESPDRFFENLKQQGLNWSCGRLTRPEVLERYGETVFYQGAFPEFWITCMEKELSYEFPNLPVGGCVTADAFVTAEYLGFETIILVGQDMAFTGGVSHTKGIEGAFGENDAYIRSRYRMTVEGIHGEVLETDFQMWRYKKWFEDYLRLNGERLKVIDATEGGARIEGTRIQPLEETVSEECQRELDIYTLIHELPPAFTAEQQERLFGELGRLKTRTKEFKALIEDMLMRCRRVMDWLERQEENQKKWLPELRYIMDGNQKIQQEGILELLISYVQEAEYELGDTVYTEDLSIRQMVDKNAGLYQGYLAGIELLLEDIEQYILGK